MSGTRFAVTGPQLATRTSPRPLDRLSRYPTRSPAAVPGRVGSRNRWPSAPSDPVSCALAAFSNAVGPAHGPSDRSKTIPRLIQFVGSGP